MYYHPPGGLSGIAIARPLSGMDPVRESVTPGDGKTRRARRRLGLRGELLLVALPTATVLIVLTLVEAITSQRLLFASLASSAFLIYMDPQHGTNSIRTLILSQMSAAVLGYGAITVFGPVYAAAATAMVLTIALMVLLDVVHPPAVATALAFALRSGPESNLLLFSLAVGIVAILVALERLSLWILARYGSS